MGGRSFQFDLSLLRKIDSIASVVGLIVSTCVLIGWALDVEQFKRILPGLTAMNPTSAVAFGLVSVSLWLSQTKYADRRMIYSAAKVCAGVVALIGLLKLCWVLFNWDVGVDRLIFRNKLATDQTGIPNRMAPNSALNLLWLGCALLLLDVQVKRTFYLAQIFVIFAFLGSLLPVVGYAYGTKPLYDVGAYTPMALHSAFTFLLLSVGILFARPGRGITETIMSEGISGVVMRRFTPAVIIVPIVLGWMRLEGQRHFLYNTELGAALLVGAHIVVFAALLWWNSLQLLRLDNQRKRAEEQMHELSLTDDLTGLRNRRGFLLLTEQELKLARNKRTTIGLWLVYADLDGLKQINDSLGHEVGSEAIIKTAEVLRSSFRETDIITRLGGDEFAVLAVSNDADGGRIMLERLRDNIRSFNVREKLAYRLSLSIGVVRVDPEKAVSIDDVLEEADRAMYENKRSNKGNPARQKILTNQFV